MKTYLTALTLAIAFAAEPLAMQASPADGKMDKKT